MVRVSGETDVKQSQVWGEKRHFIKGWHYLSGSPLLVKDLTPASLWSSAVFVLSLLKCQQNRSWHTLKNSKTLAGRSSGYKSLSVICGRVKAATTQKTLSIVITGITKRTRSLGNTHWLHLRLFALVVMNLKPEIDQTQKKSWCSLSEKQGCQPSSSQNWPLYSHIFQRDKGLMSYLSLHLDLPFWIIRWANLLKNSPTLETTSENKRLKTSPRSCSHISIENFQHRQNQYQRLSEKRPEWMAGSNSTENCWSPPVQLTLNIWLFGFTFYWWLVTKKKSFSSMARRS